MTAQADEVCLNSELQFVPLLLTRYILYDVLKVDN